MSEEQYRRDREVVRRATAEHLGSHRTNTWPIAGRPPEAQLGVVRKDLPILNPPKSVPIGPIGGRPGLAEPDKTLSHSDRKVSVELDRGTARGGIQP